MGSLTVQSKTNSKETELTYWHEGKCQISSRNNTTTKITSSHKRIQSYSSYCGSKWLFCVFPILFKPLWPFFPVVTRADTRPKTISHLHLYMKKSLKTWSGRWNWGKKTEENGVCKAWTSISLSTWGGYLQHRRGLTAGTRYFQRTEHGIAHYMIWGGWMGGNGLFF